jgi:hypothetical protein
VINHLILATKPALGLFYDQLKMNKFPSSINHISQEMTNDPFAQGNFMLERIVS